MKVFLVLAASLAVALGEYGSKPDKRCDHLGQFLKNGDDKCSYLRCTYGVEPWIDSYGKVQLYTVEQLCPYGTSMSDYYYGGDDNPCTDRSEKCHKPAAYKPTTYKKEESYGYEPKPQQGYGKPDYKPAATTYKKEESYGYDPKPQQGYGKPSSQPDAYKPTTYKKEESYGYDPKPQQGYGKPDYPPTTYGSSYEKKESYGYDPKPQRGYGYNPKPTYGATYEKKESYGYDPKPQKGYGQDSYSPKRDYGVTYEKQESYGYDAKPQPGYGNPAPHRGGGYGYKPKRPDYTVHQSRGYEPKVSNNNNRYDYKPASFQPY